MTPIDPRRMRLVSDAVVASYIHEISARAGSGAIPEPPRRLDRIWQAAPTPGGSRLSSEPLASERVRRFDESPNLRRVH